MAERIPLRFAHIVNPVNTPADSELGTAQPITFQSIANARAFIEPHIQVAFYCVGFDEDQNVAPDFFERLPVLKRSVNDLQIFSTQKKYPILWDVLNAVYNNTDADFLIYTNMDIALMPQFYNAVTNIISSEQCDALVVNRRGISKKYNNPAQLSLMYSDYGMPHPGFDCFIFKRALLPQLILDDVCLGVSFSEVAMIHNLIAFAQKLVLEDKMHLTFHIGTEVMPPLNEEYYNYNRTIYEQKIYPKLKPLLRLHKFPYAMQPAHLRLLKWALNPSFRTHLILEMEGKSIGRKLKYILDSWRFALLGR